LHLRQVTLGERQLLTQRDEFALQHTDALAMLRRKPIGDGNRFLVPDFPGEPAAAFRVRQPLAFESHFALGAHHRFLDLGDGDFGVHDGFAHLARELPQIRSGRRIEGGAERVTQALEQVPPRSPAQLLRTVFAKKSEKTGSTSDDAHLGQVGERRAECSAIVSVREKSAWHAVQRYSYNGMGKRYSRAKPRSS
jgi:hypothetical protein